MDMNLEKEVKKEIRLTEQLVGELDDRGIRYCHWKSNEHLRAGLEGRTDLDILVDKADVEDFTEMLRHLNFKKAISSPETTYRDVENWIGFCGKTGILLHLHVHYELVTGKEFVKEYVLPWRAYMLETAVRERESGFLIADPNIEIITLLLRIAIKSKYSTMLLTRIKNGISYGNAMQKELDYLHERVEEKGLEEAFDQIFPAESELKTTLRQLVSVKKLDVGALRKVKREARKEFSEFIRYGEMEAILRYLAGSTKQKWNLVMERMGFVVLRRKHFESGGVVIALVGLETEDREKLLHNLEKWLKWKMEVSRFPIEGESKEKLVVKIQHLKAKGSIVLLDLGYDSPEIIGRGPIKRSVKGTKFTLHLVPDAKSKEEALQGLLSAYSPDLVIRMRSVKNQVQDRERIASLKGTSIEDRLLQIPEGWHDQKVYEVDQNLPLEKLILNTRRIIWQNI